MPRSMVETFTIVEDLWGSATYQGTSTGCVLVRKVQVGRVDEVRPIDEMRFFWWEDVNVIYII